MTSPMQRTLKDFDSTEEWEFWNWLLEAEKHELVSDIEYHSKTFILSEKIEYPKVIHLKTKDKIIYPTLLNGCTYTPDFQFKIHSDVIREHIKKLHTVVYDKVIVDTKGSFGSSKNTAHATFPIKAKWMFQKHGLYIEKVVPGKLFKKTWVPEAARYTEKKKIVKKEYRNTPIIKKYLEERE